MKRLIWYMNLLCVVGFAQIKEIPSTPENMRRSLQSIEFRLTKFKADSNVIWNNYYSEHEIPDSAFYNLSSVKIKYSIIYPLNGDTLHEEPFVYNGHSRLSEKVIILPYSKFQLGMRFLIDFNDTASSKQMQLEIKLDSLNQDELGDRTFCFNYIPFLPGKYCFSGKDIAHWDVQTATINPGNRWVVCGVWDKRKKSVKK